MNHFLDEDDLTFGPTPSTTSYSSSSDPRLPKGLPNDMSSMKASSSSSIIRRNLYTDCILHSSPESPQARKTALMTSISRNCKCSPASLLLSMFPILCWLPKYNWRRDLTFDLVAGGTICVMHIPQGMAYALLGNLQPVVGIYMAFFPVIVYTIMGTSRHISMGTFAVICLMTGKVASERLAAYSTPLGPANSTYTFDDNSSIPMSSPYTIEQIATVISFAVGIWQVIMGALRLGSLSVLLSTELVSGFTTGAAVHVLTSQIKNLFGLTISRRTGIFKIPLSYYDIVMNISSSNITAVIISIITIFTLVIYSEILKPIVARKIPLPIPIELLTIIIGTLVSKYWITSAEYGIPIVNHIPTGLPTPSVPPMEILPDVLVDGLIIAIVAYTISISMAKIFANKHGYDVDSNQELVANGASNFVGSFFCCAPIAASLSRSLIQEQVGGKTQLAGLFSCSILVFVLLWIGPFFETLPQCVLSSMIVVALKGMFMQVHDLPKAWKESQLNAIVWVSSFLATVLLDIEYGLGFGMLFSIFNLIWKSNRPYISMLGAYKGSKDVYVDATSPQAKEIPGLKIIKYTGSLNFATAEFFGDRVIEMVPPTNDHDHISRTASGVLDGVIVSTISKERINENNMSKNLCDFRSGIQSNEEPISWLIFDMSSVSSIDPAAVKAIHGLYKVYMKKDIQMLFIGCPSPIIDVMDRCSLIKAVGINSFYPTVQEAVTYCCSISTYHHGEIEPENNLPRFDNNNGSPYTDTHNTMRPDFGTILNT